LGVAGVFGDFLQVPLARTFDLYELWVFLRLLRAAVLRSNAQTVDLNALFRQDTSGLTLAAGSVTVPIAVANISLCFQRQYQEYWTEAGGRSSFSRPVLPDIAVEAAGGSAPQRLIVLDAKYRINDDLNTALASIHMYRDALVSGGQDNSRPDGSVQRI